MTSVWNVIFFPPERKQITLTVGNQLTYKKIYNVVGYLKGKHNPGLNACCFLLSRPCRHTEPRWKKRVGPRARFWDMSPLQSFGQACEPLGLEAVLPNLWNVTIPPPFGWIYPAFGNTRCWSLLTFCPFTCSHLCFLVCFCLVALLVVAWPDVVLKNL